MRLPRDPIGTRRLVIRPLVEGDLDAAYRVRSDPDVGRFLGGEMSREESDARIREHMRNLRDSGLGARAVVWRETGEVIGWCGLQQLFGAEEIELFYGYAKEMWGRGIAVEAAAALLEAGFRHLGCRKFVAIVLPENHASQRVLEKLGFHPSGTYPHPSGGIEHLLYELEAAP